MGLKVLRRQKPYEGRVFTVVVDEVEYPSGNKSIREVAQHGGGAVALPVFPDEQIMLVKQHRYPMDEFVWELPAGKMNVGEDPLQCARRELEEETGYRALEWKKITAIYTTPGFCSEVLHIYLARNLHPLPEGRKLEEGEQSMTLTRIPLQEAVGMIERQQIVDAKTICGVLLGERMLRKGQGAVPGADEKVPVPKDRAYILDLKRCVAARCGGELAELSYYERNNWVTVEMQCNTCRKRFVVKVEL